MAVCLAGILTAIAAISGKVEETPHGWLIYIALAVFPLIAIGFGSRLYRISALLLLLFILFRAYTEFRRWQYLRSHFIDDPRVA